jgi:peptide-methionine (S)-S-oxide reductase
VTNDKTKGALETAILGGGCFWCLEAVFQEVPGVIRVVPGYAGGSVAGPSYEAVCTGMTGHAEAVQITYDAATLTYEQVLRIFFATHDPTTLNRQGPDTGTQYRSVIFYHDAGQQRTAEALRRELDEAHVWDRPLVTQISPLDKFYPAESYHRDYFARHPDQPYCRAVISPKLAEFRRQYLGKLKS